MSRFSYESFATRAPFPWADIAGFLTTEAFEQLLATFPEQRLFSLHEGLMRTFHHRPHNRYYLAYEESLYKRDSAGNGIATRADLAPPWQALIAELATGEAYRAFAAQALGTSAFRMRFAWHIGFTGCEVSPHRDAARKIGTHIFYFNTSEDWDLAWGGSTIVLADMKAESPSPDWDDFATQIPCELRDNHSFIFKNTKEAWHGAKTLSCPEGRQRRLFNVIFEREKRP